MIKKEGYYILINNIQNGSKFELITLPEEPNEWLKDCYKIIDCESIEVVQTVINDIILIIDSEGKLWDGWEDRINVIATLFYGSKYDQIVGNAILARKKGENIIPLNNEDFENIVKLLYNIIDKSKNM